MDIPEDITAWLSDVFTTCNARITQKLSNIPNINEESLDLTWIEHLSQFASPVTLESQWTIKIEIHYLGGLRHFRTWEIADVGLLLFIRRAGKLERSKVALLQSKRLYPTNNYVNEENRFDYEIGFARLADQEDLNRTITTDREFEFTGDCEYGALVVDSDQVKAIKDYQSQNGLSVYYQFYNPWEVPFNQIIPLTSYQEFEGAPKVGVRILPAKQVHDVLGQDNRKKPTFEVLSTFNKTHGWSLQSFVSELFLHCKEGSRFDKISDDRIDRLFYRRSGPIAAAIAISIEGPDVGQS